VMRCDRAVPRPILGPFRREQDEALHSRPVDATVTMI